jgi:hypothetical protein
MKKISESAFKKMEHEVWVKYFASSSPSDWHQTVMTKNYGDVYNGGDGEWIFQWILDNPLTEKATVLMMYWMLGPRLVTKKHNIVDAAEKKLLNGFHTQQNFGFDPSCDHDEYDWVSEYKKEKKQRNIPEALTLPVVGEMPERSDDFEDGLPLKFAQLIFDILDKYEIEA